MRIAIWERIRRRIPSLPVSLKYCSFAVFAAVLLAASCAQATVIRVGILRGAPSAAVSGVGLRASAGGRHIAVPVSFTVSVIFNYLASMRYVFTHKEGMSRRREFVIFVTLSVIGLLINNACMWVGVEMFGWHYLIVKIGATFIVMIWNFVSRKVLLDGGDAPQAAGTVRAAKE